MKPPINKTLHLFAPCPCSPVAAWGTSVLSAYPHAINYRWSLAADWLDTVLAFDRANWVQEPCFGHWGK